MPRISKTDDGYQIQLKDIAEESSSDLLEAISDFITNWERRRDLRDAKFPNDLVSVSIRLAYEAYQQGKRERSAE